MPNKKPRQLCKVEEVFGSNSSDIEDEINVKLAEGWLLNTIIAKANKVYLVFIK